MDWKSTSDGMEASIVLKLCKKVYVNRKYNIYIGTIVCDDDNMIVCHLKHKGDVRKLPDNIHEPLLLANSSH